MFFLILAMIALVGPSIWLIFFNKASKKDDRTKVIPIGPPEKIVIEIQPSDALLHDTPGLDYPVVATIRKKFPHFKEITMMHTTIAIDEQVYRMDPAYTRETHGMLKSIARDPLVAPAYKLKITLTKL